MEVFYITNRREEERVGTLKNLRQFGFPFADQAHLLFKQQTSDKESRRQKVSDDYEIVLFLGDNLSDFSAAFNVRTPEERLQITCQQANTFGQKYIILLNPVYGDWEYALQQHLQN